MLFLQGRMHLLRPCCIITDSAKWWRPRIEKIYRALKKYIWGILYSLILTAFTVDTFVIARVYTTAPAETDSGSSAFDGSGEAAAQKAAIAAKPVLRRFRQPYPTAMGTFPSP